MTTTPAPSSAEQMPAGRWYVVSFDDRATLCVDEADARKVEHECNLMYTRHAPHRAVMLVDADQVRAYAAQEVARVLDIDSLTLLIRSFGYTTWMQAEEVADAIIKHAAAIRARNA